MASRNWCFTLNNPTGTIGIHGQSGPLEETEFPDGLRYCIYQLESGANGTRHFQGYCEFSKPHRLSAFKSCSALATAHMESRRGTREQAREYCRKTETRVAGPWEIGTFESGGQGKRTDWTALKEDVKKKRTLSELSEDHFALMVRHGRNIIQVASWMRPVRNTKTKIIVVFGEPGTGKTYWANEQWPGAYQKPAKTKWFDGYNGEDAVIFDEFSAWFPFDLFKRIGDHTALKVESKGGYLEFTSKYAIFISNFHPKQWWYQLFQEYPHQFKALARRVDEVYKFTAFREYTKLAAPFEEFFYSNEWQFNSNVESLNSDTFN